MPTAGYRVPGGVALIWLAASFALYLVGLSLLQQYRDAGNRVPPEWWLLASALMMGTFAWILGRSSRDALTDTQRSDIIHDRDRV